MTKWKLPNLFGEKVVTNQVLPLGFISVENPPNPAKQGSIPQNVRNTCEECEECEKCSIPQNVRNTWSLGFWKFKVICCDQYPNLTICSAVKPCLPLRSK